MPTSTFFRLPEEKRARLIGASWEEVSRARFSEMSINRIITAARIPRGSFYQYFEDKEDLIRYLLEDMREYFISLLRNILIEADGDVFAFPLLAYDRFMRVEGGTDPMLKLIIDILQRNKGMDVQSLMGGPGPCAFLPDALWDVIDVAKLRRGDREYADHVFHLTCAVLAFAVAEALWDPARLSGIRETLQARIDLLRYGGAADGYKEASI